MPEGFEATAALEDAGAAALAEIDRERFWMHLARDAERIALSGQVPDAAAKAAMETEAAALFGAGRVQSALLADGAAPPSGWETAAMRALGYLAQTAEGEADLAGNKLSLRGRVTDPQLVRMLHDRAVAELPDYRVETAFVVDLPAALGAVPLPPVRCAAELNRTARASAIDFETGSAALEPGSEAVLDALAAVLARCVGGAIVVGGHTDAQGSEQVNRRISQARAEAVVEALAGRGVPLDRIVAAGFGEERPVASNESAAGRARNRRIEFEPARPESRE
jgi:OOP family OmpA-OmpF porin